MGNVLTGITKIADKSDPTGITGKVNEFSADSGLDFGLLSGAERDKEFKREHAKKQAAFDKAREQQRQETTLTKKREVARSTAKPKTQSLLTRTI